jgi:hypothetical protein
MKKGFHIFINKIFKKDLELLYGVGSSVDIESVIYSTNKKIYVVSCKLYVSDVNLFEEVGGGGLNYMFEEAWRSFGFRNENFMLQISFDLT